MNPLHLPPERRTFYIVPKVIFKKNVTGGGVGGRGGSRKKRQGEMVQPKKLPYSFKVFLLFFLQIGFSSSVSHEVSIMH